VQMLNYVGHRAMFEGLNAHLWNPASGRLMWMSHPAWPSTEWQLYSSDYDAHASYFGVQKACEPVHIQLNLHDRKVVITNSTLEAIQGARVQVDIVDLSGRRVSRQNRVLTAAANATTEVFALREAAASELPVYFVKLNLAVGGGRLLSDNFYWLARRDEDYRSLDELPQVALTGRARHAEGGARIELELRNPAKVPVLMVKATLRDADGRRLLPAFASDNYFSLLPGELRWFHIEPRTPVDGMQVTLEGWNVAPVSLPVK